MKAGVAGVALAVGFTLAAVGSAAGGETGISSVQLATMLLPKAALGAQAANLPLTQDSGVVSNRLAAANANGHVTAADLTRLGRITGYALDYGGAPAGGNGLDEAGSAVNLYETSAEARAGLTFWRKDEQNIGYLRAVGFVISQRLGAAPGLGGASFLERDTVTLTGKPPLQSATVLFQLGRTLAGVSVSGAAGTNAAGLALSLARDLRTRVGAVLSGKIAASRSALRSKLRPGPPLNGPKLDALAVTSADLGGGKIASQGYALDADLNPVSEYQRKFSPGGPFAVVAEQVALFRSPTQASFELAAVAAIFGSNQAMERGSGSGSSTFSSYSPRSVPASGGDETRVVLAKARLSNGVAINVGFVIVRVGATVELLSVGMAATDTHAAAELKGIATVAASRARRGLNAVPVA